MTGLELKMEFGFTWYWSIDDYLRVERELGSPQIIQMLYIDLRFPPLFFHQ